ncbi:MAG: adenylate/guanylate cyclase domain-containing protein [Treponema sp.]|jgi:adenylate cyclase|nr:adenylate/guanylate cyclase domain-containing protein [Treponema sp.]
MKLWRNALLGFVSAAVFSLLYLLGVMRPLEDRLYDFFLSLRQDRKLIEEVVFLDVDDEAIAYNGVFPWPRSIPADGLLRLKEHGARAAIFDIEFIDRGPQGVDSLYLNQGLAADFTGSFDGISQAAADLLSALNTGRVSTEDIGDYGNELLGYIADEGDLLYTKAQSIARDNDIYLARAIALFGKSWSTLNLRKDLLTDEEQLARRPIAEELFSYPVQASPNAHKGNFIDVLPALPIFAQASRGAGYANVEVDNDGIRRRVYLTQNVYDHWYLQLAFAPLIDYLGNPEIIQERQRLTIKDAQIPGGEKKDIIIPLDSEGRMMLDWPKTNYRESFTHHSFAYFSLLDDIEAEIEMYSRQFSYADFYLFAQLDPELYRLPFICADLIEAFDAAAAAKNDALENTSDESFNAYLEHRTRSRVLLRELLSIDPAARVDALEASLIDANPEFAAYIAEQAEFIRSLASYLQINLKRGEELNTEIHKKVNGKLCILGRTDTGTTDLGANPFYGEYENVGTHGVVLDNILSESFITEVASLWTVLISIAFLLLFFIASARLSPVPRIITGFASALMIIAASIFLFRYFGIFFEPLSALFAMIVAIIIREVFSYAKSEKEKLFIRTAFSTYVSDDVVKEILADPSLLKLGGTKRYMSAIFTDVQGFSGISEKLGPEELVSLLNRYLTLMSNAVLDEEGTIDKYEGDAIVAFFGAPLDLPDHALRACLSAINMKRIEAELNQIIIDQKLSPAPLLTRIGINTGDMVAGNMGTENKMDYTIMGNAVNLAARLEGVNKQYGTWILASENTIKECGGRILARKLDRVRVVGINEPIRLYEPFAATANATAEQKNLIECFHNALSEFENRNWEKAAAGFRQALEIREDDPPSKKFLARCIQFIEEGPSDSWDGVYNLTEK